MARFRRHPLFFAALLCAALLALGEAAYLVAQIRAADRAQRRLEVRRREAAALARVEPAPTPDTATQIEADLAAATQALAAMRASLAGRAAASDAAAVPARPADAYFEIAEYVERLRDRAKQAGVAIAAEERFGFADYANAGPAAELIPAVHRQRIAAEYLLETLFAARPHRLLGLQRERPAAPAGAAARPDGAASVDTFEVPASVTARVPDFVEATGFRVSFTGTTSVLRDWLNRLATFERPMVVRSVEVDRAPDTDAAAEAGDEPDAPRPLVPRSRSRFTVIVEEINLLPAPAAPAS